LKEELRSEMREEMRRLQDLKEELRSEMREEMRRLQDLKEELRSEMREEMRRLQDRMTEACEQRIETPFAVYDRKFDRKFDQKIDDLTSQMTTQFNQLKAEQQRADGDLSSQIQQLKRSDTSSTSRIRRLEETANTFFALKMTDGYKYPGQGHSGNFRGPIHWNEETSLPDGAFELTSNGAALKFKISGLYTLTFSGQSGYGRYDTNIIKVKKNGEFIFNILDYNDADKGDINNMAYTWADTIQSGDTIELDVSSGHLFASSTLPLTFTGQLIKKQ